jgi:HPt (histidine-containing phosphotransfer) domain-containing protein
MQGFLQKPFTEAQLLELVTGFFPEKEAAPDTRPAMPVNPEELEKLAGNDKAFFNEMIRIFIKSGENALNAMQQSFQAKNWSAIGEAAHKLSAPAKHLAALSLYNKLKILEKEAPSGNDQLEIKQLIEQIADEFQQIKAILEEKMKKSGNR